MEREAKAGRGVSTCPARELVPEAVVLLVGAGMPQGSIFDHECARYRRHVDPFLGCVEDLKRLDARLLPEDGEALRETELYGVNRTEVSDLPTV